MVSKRVLRAENDALRKKIGCSPSVNGPDELLVDGFEAAIGILDAKDEEIALLESNLSDSDKEVRKLEKKVKKLEKELDKVDNEPKSKKGKKGKK